MTEPDAQWIFEHVRMYIEGQLDKQQAEIDRRVATLRLEIGAVTALYDRVLAERDHAIALADSVVRETLEREIQALRRELAVTNEASERAIAKSEAALEKRLENVNAWRGQASDRERSSAEERAKLHGTLLPRETFEAWKEAVERRLNAGAGERRGSALTVERLIQVITVLIALVAVVYAFASH